MKKEKNWNYNKIINQIKKNGYLIIKKLVFVSLIYYKNKNFNRIPKELNYK